MHRVLEPRYRMGSAPDAIEEGAPFDDAVTLTGRVD